MSTTPDNHVLVGLTGSIGAGKSTVADLFEKSGIPVLRADQIAKELMTSNVGMKQAITEAFGPQAYVDGQLDRKYLASQIFNDREKLETMNEIVHPRTIAEQGMRAQKLFDEGHRVVACEAALIFETEGENRFDYVVVVDAAPELRFARAAERDNCTTEEAQQRDAMQMPAQRKAELADFVIKNNGTAADLERNTSFVVSLLKALPPRDRLEVDDEGEGEEE